MPTEHAGVDGVHRLKLVHVDEEHAAAEYMLQARTGRLQNRLNVLQTLLSLRLGVGCERTGRWFDAGLSRDEHQALEAHARRVGSDRLREIGGLNGYVRHQRMVSVEREPRQGR